MRFLIVAMLLLGCLALPSCIPADPITEAVNVIDRGREDIVNESDSWQSVLQRVADQLPEDISEVIRNDAQNLASRSIAKGGAEFRCDVDFLADRAIASLRRLKAKLLEENPPPLPPAFCQVVPDAIDLNASPSSWSKVTLHGYDLDHKDIAGNQFKILLLDDQGATKPLPEDRIGRTTHYQVTLNLGGMAKQIHQDKVVKILVSWSGSTDSRPEIVVIPWEPKQTTKRVDMAVTTYTPPRVKGDGDFNTDDDDPMDINVCGVVKMFNQSVPGGAPLVCKTGCQYIDSRVKLRAREEKGDHTTVEGWSYWARVYEAPKNWRIISFDPRATSYATGKITSHGKKTYDRPAGEVVDHFVVWGDRKGDEAGTYTKVEVHWRSLEVTLEQINPEWASQK